MTSVTVTQRPLQPKPFPGPVSIEDHITTPLVNLIYTGTRNDYRKVYFPGNKDGTTNVDMMVAPVTFTSAQKLVRALDHRSVASNLVPAPGGFLDAVRAAHDLLNKDAAAGVARESTGVAVLQTVSGYGLLRALGHNRLEVGEFSTPVRSAMTDAQISKIDADKSGLDFRVGSIRAYGRTTSTHADLAKVEAGSSLVKAWVTTDGYFDLQNGAATESV